MPLAALARMLAVAGATINKSQSRVSARCCIVPSKAWCLHGMSRERSKRERSDKFGCRLRHADAHCSTRLDQKPYELTGLVGGDAAVTATVMFLAARRE